MKDLSFVHAPINDLFSFEDLKTDWKQYKLSQDQLNHFEEFGYVAGVKVLEPEHISILREELQHIFDMNESEQGLFYEYYSNESGNPDTTLFHALGAWRVFPGFHDILWNPSILVPAMQLLKGDVRFWHDQLFCKPAKHGGVVAWHQDYSYWTRSKPMQHLTCWMGLDDATLENGCMHYIPGSHKWDLLDMPELGGDMDKILDYLDEKQQADFKPVPIELKQGYATFHHPLLVHGSYENHSERPRRGVVLNYFKDGTFSDTDEPLLPGTPSIKRGNPIEGQFYPKLLSVDQLI
ncbi:phytanoyl-CoA dioxygenase family protein [Membranihabitans maritimus]|uniref:phytanoyl-CoA dioxygenase family protein n=1 Tax=Membranihabitans maritimus TaxID=2904244 RepID=UPI001F414DD1|nr:phytanoyl-CoA dioxygenase family protein [Membranihabitans maritimus]